MDKFVVTPEMFNDPNGFYIVCKSQEELDACLVQLHNIGILWRSGETLITPNQVKFDGSNEASRKAKKLAREMDGFAGLVARVIAEHLDDADGDGTENTYAILIGNPPVWELKERTQIPYTVGYSRVKDWYEESRWCLRAKRVLFTNCTFNGGERGAATEVCYDDEN